MVACATIIAWRTASERGVMTVRLRRRHAVVIIRVCFCYRLTTFGPNIKHLFPSHTFFKTPCCAKFLFPGQQKIQRARTQDLFLLHPLSGVCGRPAIFSYVRHLSRVWLALFGQGLARSLFRNCPFPCISPCCCIVRRHKRWLARLSAFGSWFMAPNFSLWFVTPRASTTKPASIIYLTRRALQIFWLFQNEQQNKWEKTECGWMGMRSPSLARCRSGQRKFSCCAPKRYFFICALSCIIYFLLGLIFGKMTTPFTLFVQAAENGL